MKYAYVYVSCQSYILQHNVLILFSVYTDYVYSILSVITSPVYSTCNGGLSYDIGHVRCPTLCGQKRLPLGSCPSTPNTCASIFSVVYMQNYMEQYSKITCNNIICKLIHIYIINMTNIYIYINS